MFFSTNKLKNIHVFKSKTVACFNDRSQLVLTAEGNLAVDPFIPLTSLVKSFLARSMHLTEIVEFSTVNIILSAYFELCIATDAKTYNLANKSGLSGICTVSSLLEIAD